MRDQSGDNVHKIREFLHDQGFQLEEKGDSLHVTIDSGHLITIYALQRDSDYFWASFETRVADQKKRQSEIKKVKDTLIKGFIGLAEVDEFKQTQEIDGRFVYIADVELDQSLTYQGAIIIGEAQEAEENPIEVQEIEVNDEDIDLSDDVEVKITLSPFDEALEQLETVDAKMLRKSLDMMSLKRSSNIRLALTRIFRSAGDKEEFKSSIENEARKIVSHEDQEELRIVRALSVSGFLEPVVELLWQEVL